MKKLLSVLFAVWIVKYDMYTGGNYVPCAGSQVGTLQGTPEKVFQQPLCVEYKLVPKTWESKFRNEADAKDLAKWITSQKAGINVRVEKKKN